MKKSFTNSKVKRTFAAILSSIMIISAGISISAVPASAAGTNEVMPTGSDHVIMTSSEQGTSVSEWKRRIQEGDRALEKTVSGMKTCIDVLSKSIPDLECLKLLTFMIDCLGDATTQKISLEDVMRKIDDVHEQIKNTKNTLISAMEAVSDLADFTRLFNTVSEQTKALSDMLRTLKNTNDPGVRRKMMKEYIGTAKDWISSSNIVFNLISFGNYLVGEKKLLTNDKTIYDTMMKHYSQKVLFAKEAMVLTDKFMSSAMALYLESTELVMQCIVAEKELFVENTEKLKKKSDIETAFVEANNCNIKSLELCNLIIKSGNVYKDYRNAHDPLTLYDRSDPASPQKSIVLRRDLICQKHTQYLDTGDLKDITRRSISEKAVRAIIDYISENYPGMSVSDFLVKVIGFNLNTPDASKTWLCIGNLRTESFNTCTSVVNNYFYDGIKVGDTSLRKDDVHYSYHSVFAIWDTHELITEGYVLFFETA